MKNLYLVLLLLSAFVVSASQTPGTLEVVFSKMDEVSKTFRSVESDVERIKVTVIVDDTEIKTGKFYYTRRGKEPRVKLELLKPEVQYLLINMGKLQLYTPKLKQLQEISTVGQQDMVEMYMALGFGQSSQDLKKNFEVALGPEDVLDGQKRTVLDLKPKSSNALQSIRMWLDQKTWSAVQIKIVERSKDYLTIKFTKVRLNAGIPDSRFKLPDLPKDVRIIR